MNNEQLSLEAQALKKQFETGALVQEEAIETPPTPEVRTQEIDNSMAENSERIKGMETSASFTSSRLAEVRQELSIPTPEEKPPSILATEADIGSLRYQNASLRAEKSRLNRPDQPQEVREESVLDKTIEDPVHKTESDQDTHEISDEKELNVGTVKEPQPDTALEEKMLDKVQEIKEDGISNEQATELVDQKEIPSSTSEDQPILEQERQPQIFENPNDDPLIKELETGITKKTNLDSQVSRAMQTGRTALGDSYQDISARVQRREQIHGYIDFAKNNPAQAENYANRWNDLTTQYPEIKSLPVMSWSGGEDVHSWAKKNAIKLPQGIEISRDISNAVAHNKKRQEEEARIMAAEKARKEQITVRGQISEIAKKEEAFPTQSPEHTETPEYAQLEKDKHALEAEETELENITPEQYNEETGNSFVREAPTLDDLWEDESGRSPEEREGMKEVADFIDRTMETAQESGDDDLYNEAKEYRENFTFIGNKEFSEAEKAMAEKTAEEIRRGKTVFLHPFGNRSEKFVSIKMLQQLDGMLNDEEKKRMFFSENRPRIAQYASELKDKAAIVIPDDFVLSGSRIKGAVEASTSELKNWGLSDEEIASVIQPMAMVASDQDYKLDDVLKETDSTKQKKRRGIFSYFKKRPFKGQPTGAVSGAHCSTDYGFENVLQGFQEYMKKKGKDFPMPKLAHVKRPYEMEDGTSRKYKDPELQKLYEELAKRYELAQKF